MKHAEPILKLLNEQNLLDDNGKLIMLDSLTLLDLVSRMENLLCISIPLPQAFKTFTSKQGVLDLIEAVIKQQKTTSHFNEVELVVNSQPTV